MNEMTATGDAYCLCCTEDVKLEFGAEIKEVSILSDSALVIIEGRCENCGMVIRGGEAFVDIE